MGASTVGEAFSEGVEQTPHPQSRVQGQSRHGSPHLGRASRCTLQADPADDRQSDGRKLRGRPSFRVGECFSLYNYYSERISRCEDRINEQLQALVESTSQENKHFLGEKKLSNTKLDGRNRIRSLNFNPRPLCAALCGRDMMQLPGMGHRTLLTVISECGTDMRRWPTAKHFTSWLGLAPRNKVSGGRFNPKSRNAYFACIRT
jgi:hypothetical protein